MSRVQKKSNPEKVVQENDLPLKEKKVKKDVSDLPTKEKKVKKDVSDLPTKEKKVKKDVSDLPTKDKKEASKEKKDTGVESVVSLNEPELLNDHVGSEFDVLLTQVQTVSLQLSAIKNTIKTLEKKTTRDLKLANKSKKKSKGLRKPSGFVKPAKISNELANFLNQPHGTELARTEVTKVINSYIRANNLQDPTNGRKILPDKKLTDLLNVKKEDELTYFNLQRYMSPHFAKKDLSVNEVKV